MSVSAGTTLPLTAAQREIWIAEQRLGRGNRVFRVGEYLEIHGGVDPELFAQALRLVVAEAEALHVRFVEEPGEVRQTSRSLPTGRSRSPPERGAGPRTGRPRLDGHAVARPMNLTEDPLFEYALLKLSADRFWWYQGYHHAVMDASVLADHTPGCRRLHRTGRRRQGGNEPIRHAVRPDHGRTGVPDIGAIRSG